jgi:hypothetical protein
MNKFRVQTYNIGIIRKDFTEIKNELALGEIAWLSHSYKDRYFADPFLLRQDEVNFFILAEEYIFWEEKGKIVLLTIDKNSFTLKKKSLLIEEPFHISYPFCEENGRIITVEASASGMTYECYLTADGTNVQGKKIIAYTGLIDQTLFIKDNIEWILATDIDKPFRISISITGKQGWIILLLYQRTLLRMILKQHDLPEGCFMLTAD